MAKAVREDLGKPVEPWIRHLKPESRTIVEILHRLVLASGPSLKSSLKWGNPFYTGNGMVCFIMVAKKHVNLGFMKGAELKDPRKLFAVGSGKSMRTLKITSPKEIPTAAVQAFVKQAVALDRNP